MRRFLITTLILTFILFAGILAAGDVFAADAPPPAKPVDKARFYQGRWYEIGRRPMWITNNCVAGTTDYRLNDDGTVAVTDACHRDGVDGKLVQLIGLGTILDKETDTKLSVKYNFLITWVYCVLDHDEDYTWFISSDPSFKNLWIYTRKPPTPDQRDALVARAKALGYDVAKLEFPAQPAE